MWLWTEGENKIIGTRWLRTEWELFHTLEKMWAYFHIENSYWKGWGWRYSRERSYVAPEEAEGTRTWRLSWKRQLQTGNKTHILMRQKRKRGLAWCGHAVSGRIKVKNNKEIHMIGKFHQYWSYSLSKLIYFKINIKFVANRYYYIKSESNSGWIFFFKKMVLNVTALEHTYWFDVRSPLQWGISMFL